MGGDLKSDLNPSPFPAFFIWLEAWESFTRQMSSAFFFKLQSGLLQDASYWE